MSKIVDLYINADKYDEIDKGVYSSTDFPLTIEYALKNFEF